jgi:DNA-binding transcriptional LysR family regulator
VELRHLETFRAIVDAGSFLKAARQTRYAQSTVTLHVQQLEEELGLALFERSGKRVTLTDAGRALYDEASRVLERMAGLRETMSALSSGAAGEVRLGAIEPTASLRLPAILTRLCAGRPRLALSVEVGGSRTLCHAVAAGDLDLVVASPPPARLGLAFEPLFVEALSLLVPARHPLARRRTVRAADLKGERILLSDPQCAYRQRIEAALGARGANAYSGIEIGSLLALRGAVEAGLGLAVIPAVMATPPPPGTRARLLPDEDLGLPVGLIRRRDAGRPGPALAAALDALRHGLRT